MSSKYIFILLFFFIASCKPQEEPVDVTETPKFAAKATVNGETFNLTAGENNYYMFSSFMVDPNNVAVFKGELKQEKCTNCGPSLSLSIRSNVQGNLSDMNTALAAGYYDFFDSTGSASPSFFKVAFKPSPSGLGAASHFWDFGNGKTGTSATPVVTYAQAGTYTVTYTASFSNGCSSTISMPLFVDADHTGNSTDFNWNYPDTLEVLFNSIPVDSNISVSWDFGDGQFASGPITSHTYQTAGQYKVCMKTNPGSDTFNICKMVSTRYYVGCAANFSYALEEYYDTLNLSDIDITWTDPAGAKYYSKSVKQLAGSSFKVVESSDYIRNELGQKTRKLKVVFSCKASDGISIIELSNVEATIAVAYP